MSDNTGECPKCGATEGCCCALGGMLVVDPAYFKTLESENKELKARAFNPCMHCVSKQKYIEDLEIQLSDSKAISKRMLMQIEQDREQFRAIRDSHHSCEQPTEQEEREVHTMFHIAEEGIRETTMALEDFKKIVG